MLTNRKVDTKTLGSNLKLLGSIAVCLKGISETDDFSWEAEMIDHKAKDHAKIDDRLCPNFNISYDLAANR